MFTVVSEEVITVLPHSRTRTHNHFLAAKAARRTLSDPDPVSVRKARDRNLFHGFPAQRLGKGAVVNDFAATHVDAVVCETDAWCNQVRPRARLLAFTHEPVGRSKPASQMASVIGDPHMTSCSI